MAYLIGTSRLYLFVVSEENTTSITASEHSVEKGEAITDHVKAEPESVSISGMLVGSGHANSLATLKSWEKSGELLQYSGGTILQRCLIRNLQASYSADLSGGCKFSMELKTVRLAAPAYVSENTTVETAATVDAGVQSVEKNSSDGVYHTVKAGDTVWALVNGPYKKYGKSCDDIMEMNPKAFSRAGDFRTLRVGARLRMG